MIHILLVNAFHLNKLTEKFISLLSRIFSSRQFPRWHIGGIRRCGQLWTIMDNYKQNNRLRFDFSDSLYTLFLLNLAGFLMD